MGERNNYAIVAVLAVLVLVTPSLSVPSLGIDHSELMTKEHFQCLLQNNRTFAYLRAWRSFGAFDVNAPKSLVNAIDAGFKVQDVGVYMFPCYSTAKTPESQAQEMLTQLKDYNNKFSSIWLDMETNPSPGCGWSTNYEENCAFTTRLVNAVKVSGKTIGIYASNYMWNQIMGGTDRCTRFIQLPLWYAHYDGIRNMSDFKPFGGWTKPAVKQYGGTSSLCNINGLDLNYAQ